MKPLAGDVAGDLLRLIRAVAEQDRCISAKLLAKAAAEQLVNGPAGCLAEDVPQGNVDGAHGLDGSPLPAVEDGAFVHAMDEPIDLERVLAHHALGQAAADLMRQRRVNDCLGDHRRRVRLADADDAGVGGDLDDQRFLAAVGAFIDIGKTQMNRFDLGDFHNGAFLMASRERKRPE